MVEFKWFELHYLCLKGYGFKSPFNRLKKKRNEYKTEQKSWKCVNIGVFNLAHIDVVTWVRTFGTDERSKSWKYISELKLCLSALKKKKKIQFIWERSLFHLFSTWI